MRKFNISTDNLRLSNPLEIKCDNGVTVYQIVIPDAELVRVDFVFMGGQWTQSHTLQSRFTFKGLLFGSDEYSAKQISELLDYYGATVSLQSTVSYGKLTLRCLRKFLPQILPIIRSMFATPKYEQQSLDIEVSHAHSAWAIKQQKVESLGKDLLYASLFGEEHPLGKAIRQEDFELISRDTLLQYKQQVIDASNCDIVITGDLSDQQIRDIAGCVPSSSSFALVRLAPIQVNPVSAIETIRRHSDINTVQAAVRVGVLLPEVDKEELPLLRLATIMLGGYFGSRLMTNIREDHGYTYDIHGTMRHYPHGYVYLIETETANVSIDNVLQEIRNELNLLVTDPASVDELGNLQRYMFGAECRRLEWNYELANVCVSLIATNQSFSDLVPGIRRQMSAKPRELQTIAAKYLNPDRFTYCVVD